jgi:hypothetical protein
VNSATATGIASRRNSGWPIEMRTATNPASVRSHSMAPMTSAACIVSAGHARGTASSSDGNALAAASAS